MDTSAVRLEVLEVIRQTVPGWEGESDDALEPQALLGADLGFTSIDFVKLATALQQRHNERFIPFQELFVSPTGEILQDISVSHLVDFLHSRLSEAKDG